MKKILFFTPSLNAGGIERVFLTYAEELHKRGYQVSYLIARNEIYMIDEKLDLISLHKKRLINSIPSLIKFLKQNKVDVIITGGEIPNAIIILITKIFHIKAKVIISHHNYFIGEHNSKLAKLVTKYIYNMSDAVVSVSFGITELLQNHKVNAQLIKTIHNPVNIEEINTKGDVNTNVSLPNDYLIFVGRLAPIKNLELLINAFSILNQSNPSLKLLIVGDGSMKSELQENVSLLQLQNNVHFLGTISAPYPLIKSSKAVILSSYSEALPTIILESLVLGKTIVSTPTKGAMEILECGKYGYISQSFDDAVEFAALIAKAISYPINSVSLQERARDFSIESKIEELEKLF
jgi:Glycosyltransferase